MSALFVLAIEVGLLYVAGSFALSRLTVLATSSSVGAKLAFYLFIAPGVALHELGHYLACLLTLTRVGAFVPFSPKKGKDGSLTFGYVEHEQRNPLIESAIGLAPMILNPLGIAVATAFLTPFFDLSSPLPAAEEVGAFFSEGPLVGLLWAYLLLSFSLGSSLSKEDLSALPAAGFLLAAAVGLFWYFAPEAFPASRTSLLEAASFVASKAAPLYLLPAVIAVVVASIAATTAMSRRSL